MHVKYGYFSGLDVAPFESSVFDEEVLQEGYYNTSLSESLKHLEAIGMEEATGVNCELFLTDYLLNFEEENPCVSYDDGSSGVECSDNEEDCSLASLKKSLGKTTTEKPKKDCSVTGKLSTVAAGSVTVKTEPVLASVTVKTEPDKGFHEEEPEEYEDEKVSERKEKDRVRSRFYRAQKNQRIRKIEEENTELRENNKALSEKNTALTEKISFLEEQVGYLEGVVANGSALSAILNTLKEHSGLEFHKNPMRSNSMKRKREDSGEKDENEITKKNSSSLPTKNGGICLHLAPGRMSLEFCQLCHKSSTMVENE